MSVEDIFLPLVIISGLFCIMAVDRKSAALSQCQYREFQRLNSHIEYYSTAYVAAVMACLLFTTITSTLSAVGLVGFHLYKRL